MVASMLCPPRYKEGVRRRPCASGAQLTVISSLNWLTSLSANDEIVFVFAQLRFAGDEHGAIVHIGQPAFVRLRRGKFSVAVEEFERCVPTHESD
jgi:hypothetical protein